MKASGFPSLTWLSLRGSLDGGSMYRRHNMCMWLRYTLLSSEACERKAGILLQSHIEVRKLA